MARYELPTPNVTAFYRLRDLLASDTNMVLNSAGKPIAEKMSDIRDLCPVIARLAREDPYVRKEAKKESYRLFKLADKEIGNTSFDVKYRGNDKISFWVPGFLPRGKFTLTLGFNTLEIGFTKHTIKNHDLISVLTNLYEKLGGQLDEKRKPIKENL